jgi:hypothetical protein
MARIHNRYDTHRICYMDKIRSVPFRIHVIHIFDSRSERQRRVAT